MTLTTRDTDSLVLDWVRLRSKGKNCAEIGKVFHVTPERVRVATNRVYSHDVKHSGESRAAVDKGYWRK